MKTLIVLLSTLLNYYYLLSLFIIYLRWPASRDFSVAAAGIEGELCVRMAEKLRIRQFNMKLFKIR